jgi:hypothetical protein
VPALFDRADGIPAATSAWWTARTGSVENSPSGPSLIGSSTGRRPVLSAMACSAPVSLTFTAMRSGVTAVRPAASPHAMTASGRSRSMWASATSRQASYSTGSTAVTSATPGTFRPASASTSCWVGLIGMPPNGSNPVTRIFAVTGPP